MDKRWKLVPIKEVRDFAEQYDSKLRAWDDRFHNFVIVQDKFGFPRAQFLYPNAFVVQYTGGYYIVFTEHHGKHILHDDESTVYFVNTKSTQNIPKVKRKIK